MATKKKALQAAAGAAGAGEATYIDDIFSTYLYTGNSSTQTITNGIDLDGEGGMVWIKGRDIAAHGMIHDTERGVTKYLIPSLTNAEGTNSTGDRFTAFNTDGFTLGTDPGSGINNSSYTYASWTFRKAPGFFDVVTYTGDGTGGRDISHNLGSTPGCIIVRNIDTAANWIVKHKSLVGVSEAPFLLLNGTNAQLENNAYGDSSLDSSTSFNVGSNLNASSNNYVAYLFAHNDGDGEFGADEDQDIIKCGSYTGTGSSGNFVDLGFEPQWLMIKRTDTSGSSWIMVDTMRGLPTGSSEQYLRAQTNDAELTFEMISVNATGFELTTSDAATNASSGTFIYIAIRRPTKTPESGTEVFAIDTMSNTDPSFTAGFPVDMSFHRQTTAGPNWAIASRLTGTKVLYTDSSTDESTEGANVWDFMDGWHNYPATVANWYAWMFKRATGFFDVVAYEGNGTAGRTVDHNLGVAPEMMWVKCRNNTGNWFVYHSGFGGNSYNYLNSTLALATNSSAWNNTDPDATQFTLGTSSGVNSSSRTYIAYLFASLDGISKVFSVTKSSGSNADVNCGFSSGARFVILKRTDSTGDWYVWDTERGIVAGNDPYLLLNSTAAENTSTDYIDPLSTGFTIVDGGLADGDYIGLAIA